MEKSAASSFDGSRSRGSLGNGFLDTEIMYKLPQKNPIIYNDKIFKLKQVIPIYTINESRKRLQSLES